MLALIPERGNPFTEVQQKFDGVWPFSNNLFEKKWGPLGRWPFESQRLDVEGFSTSVTPRFGWLEIQKLGNQALATLVFNSLEGFLEEISITEGDIRTSIRNYRFEREYAGEEGEVSVIFLVGKNLDQPTGVNEVKASSGKSWVYYQREGLKSANTDELVKGYIYTQETDKDSGYQSLTRLPELITASSSAGFLLGHEVVTRVSLLDEFNAVPDRSGVRDFPVGGPFDL